MKEEILITRLAIFGVYVKASPAFGVMMTKLPILCRRRISSTKFQMPLLISTRRLVRGRATDTRTVCFRGCC